MNRKVRLARVLAATVHALDLLETAVHDDLPDDVPDIAASNLLNAVDMLAFAIVRYRADHASQAR
jgi:hypothetical protein